MKYFKFLVIFLTLGFGVLYLLFLLGESPGKARGSGSGSNSSAAQIRKYLDTTFTPYISKDTLWYKRVDTLPEPQILILNFKDDTGARFSLVTYYDTDKIKISDSRRHFEVIFKIKKKTWSLIKKLKKNKKRHKKKPPKEN